MSTDPVALENHPKVDEKVDAQEDFVDPWNVASSSNSGINYDKLIGNREILPVVTFLVK